MIKLLHYKTLSLSAATARSSNTQWKIAAQKTAMSYNAKNYTEQGGEVTHIGGKLIIEDGAEVEGLDGRVDFPPEQI